ncbi:cupin domain-containing protein [Candidatus Dojkabacteria bacterium]|nr:cupin domain-containing protein [Candidatus Dojkabacteria bacterium]
MKSFHSEIEEETLQNSNFRKVLFTANYMQLVVMNLKPGEDIGMEVHDTVDQFIRVEAGEGKAVLDGEEIPLKDGTAVVVTAGTEHNIVNTSKSEDMKLYTIYSPSNHPDGTVHVSREEAMAAEDEHSH